MNEQNNSSDRVFCSSAQIEGVLKVDCKTVVSYFLFGRREAAVTEILACEKKRRIF